MNMLEKAARALDARLASAEFTSSEDAVLTVLAAIREVDVAEAMARAHDQEQSAQIGEPSPWDEEGDDYEEFRSERICAMQCAIDAILEENK